MYAIYIETNTQFKVIASVNPFNLEKAVKAAKALSVGFAAISSIIDLRHESRQPPPLHQRHMRARLVPQFMSL